MSQIIFIISRYIYICIYFQNMSLYEIIIFYFLKLFLKYIPNL